MSEIAVSTVVYLLIGCAISGAWAGVDRSAEPSSLVAMMVAYPFLLTMVLVALVARAVLKIMTGDRS